MFPSDGAVGYLSLTQNGGHPGRDGAHQAIRRWIAPEDGTATVSGTAKHPSNQGDGVELRLVSRRDGNLGRWVAFNNSVSTEAKNIAVKKGDTLDFLAGCNTNDGFDSYEWRVSVSLEKGPTFDAQAQFSGPEKAKTVIPLSAWARYAQALMMSNEFYFVD